MNNQSSPEQSFDMLRTLLSILGCFALCLWLALPAAADKVQRPFDWTVVIQTQQLDRQFEYQGSTLKPVVETKVLYYHNEDSSNSQPYETMWYHDGKALGLERLHNFGIDKGDGLAVNIIHKTSSPTIEEKRSAAAALLHIVLDAYRNKNAVQLVTVPAGSFDELSNELQNKHNFITQTGNSTDHPISTGINLFLQSDPPGRTQTLYYF